MKPIPDGIFKPKPTTSEAKGDMTTRVARSILDAETAARESKTAKLRLARLAMEEEQQAKPEPVKKAPARRMRKKA